MRLSLSRKFQLSLTVVLTLVIAALIALQLVVRRADLAEEMNAKGNYSATLLAAAAVQPILNYDSMTLDKLLAQAVRDPAIVAVSILNPDGGVSVAAGRVSSAGRDYQAEVVGEDGVSLGQIRVSVDTAHYEARQGTALRNIFLVLVATGLVLMGAIAVLMHRIVIRPLRGAVNRLGEIAAGDLRVRIGPGGGDEVGRLFDAMRATVEALRSNLAQMGDSGRRLSQAASQLQSVAADTSQAVARQHVETDEIARTITEMSNTVEDIARSAAETADASSLASQEAAHGRQVVEVTVRSINDLAAELESAAATIANLEQSSSNIGSVLDVINGIAEQTNLLALNAAIEAARAGDQGRGFAVVAEEVRTLARRTEQSTQEIKAMIDALQVEARSAVAAVHAGNAKAQSTMREAANADQALSVINQQVSTMTEMTTRIASAAEEQRAVTHGINGNVANISSEARATDEHARRTAKAGEDLSRLVTELQSLSSRFNI